MLWNPGTATVEPKCCGFWRPLAQNLCPPQERAPQWEAEAAPKSRPRSPQLEGSPPPSIENPAQPKMKINKSNYYFFNLSKYYREKGKWNSTLQVIVEWLNGNWDKKKIIHPFPFSSSVECTSKKYHVPFQTLWWNTQKRFWLLRVNVLLGNKENNKEDKTTNRKEIWPQQADIVQGTLRGRVFQKRKWLGWNLWAEATHWCHRAGAPRSRESSTGGAWGAAGAGSCAPGREVISNFLSDMRSRGGDSIRGVKKHDEAIVRPREDRSRPGWKYLEQNGRSKRRWEVSRSGAAVKSN